MSDKAKAWTATALKEALERADDFDAKVRLAGEGVLAVSLGAEGDMELYMAVGEEQISTSTILWARDEQVDPDGFEAMMLRNHKELLPLSALSVVEVDGREWYELFGAMSTGSTLESVIVEIRTIAGNAIELAGDLGPKTR